MVTRHRPSLRLAAPRVAPSPNMTLTQLEVPVQDALEVKVFQAGDDLFEVIAHFRLQQGMAGLPDVGQRLQRERRQLGDGGQGGQAAVLTRQGAGTVRARSSRSCTNNCPAMAGSSAGSLLGTTREPPGFWWWQRGLRAARTGRLLIEDLKPAVSLVLCKTSTSKHPLLHSGTRSPHLPAAVLQEDVDALRVLKVVGELDDVLVVQVAVQLDLVGDLKGRRCHG